MNRRRIVWSAVFLLGLSLVSLDFRAEPAKNATAGAREKRAAAPPAIQPVQEVKRHAAESYGKLPLSFEANRGQTDRRVKFLSRGTGYTLLLTRTTARTIANTADMRADDAGPHLANSTIKQITTELVPTERYLVTDFNSPIVHAFNVSDNAAVGKARAGATRGTIAVSPNGRLAFVANLNSNFVSAVDLTINAEVARIRGILSTGRLALSPDGTRLVVPTRNADEVVIIDTSTFQILKRVSLNGLVGDDPNDPNDIRLGAVLVVGSRAYINTGAFGASSFRIAVVDLNTFAASSIANSAVGFGPQARGIAATPDGKHVVVTRSNPHALLIIDTLTNTLAQTVRLPTSPHAITITRSANDPNGVFGYLGRRGPTFSNVLLSVVDFRLDSSTFGQLIAGAEVTLPFQDVHDIGLTADGKRAIVSSEFSAPSNNVALVDTGLLRTSPAGSVLEQLQVGGPNALLSSVVVDFTQSRPPPDAPTILNVDPNVVTNDIPRTVTLTGSGFAPGARVRFGTLDPVTATFISPTTLQAVVPQAAPAQSAADVIVTNPNSTGPVIDQQKSGIIPLGLRIDNSPRFQPVNQVAITQFGDNALAVLNLLTRFARSTPVSLFPQGVAISPDGQRAYVEAFGANTVDVVNLGTGLLEKSIPLPNDTFEGGQLEGIAIAPNPATGRPTLLRAGQRHGHLQPGESSV